MRPLPVGSLRGSVRRGWRWTPSYDGAAAVEVAAQTAYDVIVLDRDLPVVHGDQVCRRLAGSGPRILMLTAATQVEDRVDGLELGADDYLGKPFVFAELVARVRALSRRTPSTPPVLRRGDLSVDRARHRANRGSRPLSLTGKEFGILEMLLAADGALVSAEELLEHVWDADVDPFSNIVSRHVDSIAAQARRSTAYRNRDRQGIPDVSHRPRLTVRARLTLLYTGLFAVCGAIVVAVSYILVARLEPQGQSEQAPASFLARCRSEQLSAHPNDRLLAKCNAYFQLQGAQHQRDVTLSHLLQYSLITLAMVIALAAILGWIVAGRVLRPLQRITAAARAASERNLSARVALRGPRDELHELAETFDEMLDRLQSAFDGQRRFIANASHELRTPLAVMRATVDVVLDNPDSNAEDLRDMAADIRVAVDHAEHLIGALLILARNERGLTVHDEVDLATVAEDVLDSAALSDRRVYPTFEPAVILGDPVLVERLVANLVDNADRYNTAAGDIWISTRTVAGNSQLIVANTGTLISPADADRIFEPFQRLNERASHDGFGLGLTIVASIAAVHGGTASAHPRDNGGLSVTVTFPSAGSPAHNTGNQETDGPAAGHRS